MGEAVRYNARMKATTQLIVMVVYALACGVSLAESPKASAGIALGPWSCTGPFKDKAYGNVVRSFNFAFAPEKDVLVAGGKAIGLGAVYQAKRFPGMVGSTKRPWVKHPEWVDGYRHILPRGPAPSRNETVYVYRTITASEPATKVMRIYAEDFLAAWVNGKKLGQAVRNYGPNHYPVPLVVNLPLQRGENHLLVKITSLFGRHGFAFGIDGVTASNTQLPLQQSPEIISGPGRTNFHAGDMPYASEDERDPVAKNVSSVDAVARRLDGFRFDVTMTPMFDPPASRMNRKLNAEYSASEGGKAYTDALARLRPTVVAAVASHRKDSPRAAEALARANGAVEAMWRDHIRRLGPIVFLRCPPFGVNAIAPYSSSGSTPASICVFDPARPAQPARVIFHEPATRIYDMNLSYDARTIFFSAMRKGVAGGWQVYEIGVDGRGLKQITRGESRNISPLLLPSGRIMFVSDRANTYVQCQGQKAGLLYTCNSDGSDVRSVSANIESDHSPQIMNDGRVLFTRWDYGIERNVFARHSLWSMNPDGTGLRLFFGNTIEDPAGFWEARAIPGRPEVACTLGPHHSYHAGMVGLVWNVLGPEAPRGEGFRFVTNEIPVYCDISLPHGYQDVFPVNERQFLVSYGGDGGRKNRLYLLDDRGNRKCIYEATGKLGCWNPLLLRPRKVPPVIAPQCDNPPWVYRDAETLNCAPDKRAGTLMVQDVYQGIMPHVKRGQAKHIQVMEQVAKSRRMAGGEAWGHSPIIGRGTVHARRLIGLAPIEADGSAHFTVPAGRSISLNVLDADGKMLMRMGSDMHVMPGERQSCVGCHENRRGGVAPIAGGKMPLAARKPPAKPTRPEWGTGGLIDYQKVIQPVWDKHCTRCHSGNRPAGGIDLSGDRTRFFCMSYDNLVERDTVNFNAPYAGGHDETTPLTVGSIVSRLCDHIEGKTQCGKALPLADRQRVYTWIDANVPYYSTYTYTKVRGIGARDSWETAAGRNTRGWLVGDVASTFDKRCMSCHKTQINNQGYWGWLGGPMTQMVTVSSTLWTDRGVAAHVFPQRYPMSAKVGPELRINLTNPARSSMLQAPLAKSAGGWGLCKTPDGSPVFADTGDAEYTRMLAAITVGKARLYTAPRVDMAPRHVKAVLAHLPNAHGLANAKTASPPAQDPALRRPAQLSEGLTVLQTIPSGLKNLARGAKATSPDDAPLHDNGSGTVTEQAAIDGNPKTYWDDIDNQKLYRLKIDLPRQVHVSALRITGFAHHSFAPRSFRILCDGKEVGRIQNAVYARGVLALAIPRTACRSLELSIDACYGGSPAVREMDIYDLGK